MIGSPPASLGIVPRHRLRPAATSRRRAPLIALAVIAAAAQASPALAGRRPAPGFEATLPSPVPVQPSGDGSIFSASAGYAPLHTGLRARAVGDPLTIVLVESTTSSKNVGSKSQKSGSAAIVTPSAGPFSIDPAALNASSNSTFNGQGNAQQTSSLASTLSVTVAEVRPNGTALVRGEKRMLLSQGQEWVQFSGIVRLIDIDLDNRIASTRVADAQIVYSGKGALQRASKQGWLGQFFNMISPF